MRGVYAATLAVLLAQHIQVEAASTRKPIRLEQSAHAEGRVTAEMKAVVTGFDKYTALKATSLEIEPIKSSWDSFSEAVFGVSQE